MKRIINTNKQALPKREVLVLLINVIGKLHDVNHNYCGLFSYPINVV